MKSQVPLFDSDFDISFSDAEWKMVPGDYTCEVHSSHSVLLKNIIR